MSAHEEEGQQYGYDGMALEERLNAMTLSREQVIEYMMKLRRYGELEDTNAFDHVLANDAVLRAQLDDEKRLHLAQCITAWQDAQELTRLRAQLFAAQQAVLTEGVRSGELKQENAQLRADVQEAVRLVRVGQASDVERFANDGN